MTTLTEILGTDSVLTDATDIEPYLTDHRRLYKGRAVAVAVPRSVDQVSRLLAYCNDNRIGIVPHAGNTSYCGGATPDDSGTQVVLSLRRLNRVRNVDPLNYSLVAEAGCILADVQRAPRPPSRLFPACRRGSSCSRICARRAATASAPSS